LTTYVLGTDIGTGSTKAVAVDLEGRAVESAQFYYDAVSPQDGYMEQEPGVVFDAFVKSIREVVSRMDGPPQAISLSSAMHGLMSVDSNGQPLHRLILWSDTRSALVAEELKQSSEGETVYSITGTPIHAMSPLCKIIWLRKNSPEVFSKAAKFISVKEYIWQRLVGEFRTDHSLASATGLFDIEKLCWSAEAMELAGINAEQLPEVSSTSYHIPLPPEAAALLDVPPGTPLCIGASDGCLANLGSGAMEPGIAALTIGTSGAIRIASNRPLRDFSVMNFSYLLDEKTFICGGPVNNGGNIVQWLLKDFLSSGGVNESNYQQLFDAVEQAEAGSKGLIFLPYLNGERAPVWDAQACGVFFGIRPHHSRNHFLKAVLEGLCFALKHVLDVLEESSGPVRRIHAGGGFVRSGTWVQLLADITGKTIRVQQMEDASALGAAYLAMKTLGIISDYSELKSFPVTGVQPRMETADIYDKNYRVFRALYPQLRDTMHLLHQLNP
jgi:gluconokinase